MTLAIDLASWAVPGCGRCIFHGRRLGLVRMPDFYTRMHAASVTDTLGAGL